MVRALLILFLALFACSAAEAQQLNDINSAEFKKAFNDASANVRLVALLSPT